MTHPGAVVDGRVEASPGRRFVTDLPAHTARHIAYLQPSRAGTPILGCGDTLAALRTWKNEFR